MITNMQVTTLRFATVLPRLTAPTDCNDPKSSGQATIVSMTLTGSSAFALPWR
jgi:hypothetical protein